MRDQIDMDAVPQFYDEFSAREMNLGVNLRHRSIARWIRHFGVTKHDSVFEIGCGIGTVTSLLGKIVTKGTIKACDVSPRSIETAQQRCRRFRNVTFCVTDVLELHQEERFDVILLPDVIEHIPLDLHPALFKKIAGWLKPEGKVIIHIPEPYFLEWVIRNHRELLQIIDQPVHTALLAKNISDAGLYIEFLSSYSIWTREPDYQIILLKLQHDSYRQKPVSRASVFAGRARGLNAVIHR
jgi:trans-aconitate 2-methyltransferase